ncbi:hypothetical protein FRC11_005806 [Ceratobasidium sp. 423]|nr:hypothetical protein FRC11_005806 [Ceratobasidium sp. 423]
MKDISTVYRMMQNVICMMLTDISGVFHITLDMYQSLNGHDYLGVVLFVPMVMDNVMYIDQFVLECLSGKHTGLALANTLHGILQKFGIQDHAIAALFLNQWSELKKAPQVVKCDELGDFGWLLEDEEDDEREADNGSASVEEDFNPNEEDETSEDDGMAPSHALDPDDDLDDDLSDIEIPELIAGSIDAKALKSAHRALYNMFQELCKQLELVGPFNIQHDIVTHWNSMKSMIKDTLHLEEAILQYQKNPEYPESLCLTTKDFKVMKILLRLLKLLFVLTEIMSKSKIPMLVDIIVHYDSLNHKYCDMVLDKSLPHWAQQSANCAWLKLDKYYNLTNTSYMYHLAMILHPSNHEAYMKRLSWKPEWIAEAHKITLGTWEEHYKPADYEHGGDDASLQSQFGYLSFVDEVYGSFTEENDKPVDPVIDFIEGKPILECLKTGRSKPVNPLNWWYVKWLAGEEHDRLTQMALDILTAPAKAHRKARKCTQANAQAKATNAKAKVAEAEAMSEDEVMEGRETEDDKDVLEPSSDVEDIDLEDN